MYATQAREESYTIDSTNFATSPKQFTISDGTYTIPVTLNWDIPLNGFTRGQVVGSAVDSIIQQYCNDHGINLGNRTMSAVGFADTFFISTFKTGSNVVITLGGNDWSFFFKNNRFTGTDEDRSKNRTFTVNDGINTATVLLEWKYLDMDDLVDDIDQQLSNASLSASAVKVSENQFIITGTVAGVTLTIGGTDKEQFFE
ncbi:hypothetical protein JQN58_08360 [Aneurinibacillus sp. BA2021]|nr:hypothetical protein [Aneurinibacillus sp. BA2021]